MNLNLANKVIIVAGGAKGIGEGIVKVLATESAIPVIVGRNETDNLKTLAAIDNQGFQVVAELTSPDECENVIKKITERFRRIDGLVNDGYINDAVGLENGNYEKFVASLHKNLVGYYLITHHALPYLKQSKGPIVNIGSKAAENGQVKTVPCAASSGGRNALTREWAVELLNYEIRVNEVVLTQSSSLSETFKNPALEVTSIAEKIPFQIKMTTPEEVGKMVAFLLSDRSSHTTGQILHIGGGYVDLDGRF